MPAERIDPAPKLPARVSLPLDSTIGELWIARTRQHFEDSYAGIAMLQFPEDLRALEHAMWLSRPRVVIEIGVHRGGSTLWFRDRLQTLRQYGLEDPVQVIGVDLDVSAAATALHSADPGFADTITLVEGDVLDPELPARVRGELRVAGAQCMVVEDSAHTYDTTRAALAGFADFVAPGGFFIVQDGCVDVEEMRADPTWPRGVLPAVADWLDTAAGADFEVRRDLELYGISCHPRGYLHRTR
jgi:cephalosporin hydroxylase